MNKLSVLFLEFDNIRVLVRQEEIGMATEGILKDPLCDSASLAEKRQDFLKQG
jgi:hypothetical protein